MIKLFIDDIRNAPDDSWNLARDVTTAIRMIASSYPDVISLDHDISHPVDIGSGQRPLPCAETFEAVAYFIGERYRAEMWHDMFETRSMQRKWNPKIVIHTANVLAGERMQKVLGSYGITNIEFKNYGPAHRV